MVRQRASRERAACAGEGSSRRRSLKVENAARWGGGLCQVGPATQSFRPPAERARRNQRARRRLHGQRRAPLSEWRCNSIERGCRDHDHAVSEWRKRLRKTRLFQIRVGSTSDAAAKTFTAQPNCRRGIDEKLFLSSVLLFNYRVE